MRSLSHARIEILLRMGNCAVTASEIGAPSQVLALLANDGFLIADRDGQPIIYSISKAGRMVVDSWLEPIVPKECEAPIARIQRTVAHHFHIPLIEMTSDRRARDVARPRQVAMYLAKETTPKSLPHIGRRFGGRDHTTVLHAIRKVRSLMDCDPAFSLEVETLKSAILAKLVVNTSAFPTFAASPEVA